MRKALHQTPALLRLARRLGVSKFEALGMVYAFWSWADDHATPQGALPGFAPEDVDCILEADGFGAGMIEAGWLSLRDGELSIPEFEKYLGPIHRKRSRDAKNARAYRERQRQRNVSGVSADGADETRKRQRGVSAASDKTKTHLTSQNPSGSSRGTRARGAASSAWRSILDDTEFAALRHHDGFADAWASWLEFRRESGWSAPKAVTHRKQFRAALKFGPAAMVAAIEDSIRQGYQGLFPEKHKRPGALPIDQGSQDARSELTRPRPASEVVAYWRERMAQQGPSEGTPRDAEFEEGRHAS